MKPIPASRMHMPTRFASSSILTPSACNTSAAPDFDDSARLPCLATGMPAPATMNAAQVEMLNEPEASPPVPTTSTAPGGAFTPNILARIVVTAPVISSTVSPRTRSAINSPPICEGVASPDIMRSKAPAASSRVRVAPVATLAMSALKSSATASASGCCVQSCRFARRRGLPAALRVPGGGNIQKIFQHQMTMFGGNALGMKLHAMDGQAGMHQPHHESIARLGIDREFARHVCAFNHERMIARCLQRAVNASEDSGTSVLDLRHFAVEGLCAHDLAAEGLTACLVAQADT